MDRIGKEFEKKNRWDEAFKIKTQRELGGYGIDLFLAVQSARGKVWLLLDTGNTNKLLLAPHAQEQIGITLDKSKEKEAKPVNLELIGYESIESPARDREMIYDGMLNYDTILKMLLTIDLRDGKAWAKPNPTKS